MCAELCSISVGDLDPLPKCGGEASPLPLSLHVRPKKQKLLLERGEILTFPDTLTTQGLSLWSLNIVGGEILTSPDTLTTQGLYPYGL